ncbi:hypothetical protein DL770_010174 [Monosporascus sp. CRB-9-2]|nr:hypothetical protein DL770_010174 [Monosporascus sp. CRB-9-2]
MESAITRIEEIATVVDGTARRQLMLTLRHLAYSLEEPSDTIHRFGHSHLQTAAVKVGFDLGVFKYLSHAEKHITLEELVDVTKADVLLLGRFMRYLASIGAIKEVGKDRFTANDVTNNLAESVCEAGISHCFETIAPQYQAIPGFLRKTGYVTPTDPLHTVLQDAWNTQLHAFNWLAEHPDKLAYFNDYMASRRTPELSWLTVYPVREEIAASSWGDTVTTRAIYVNVGGGIGHQCAQFKNMYPDVPGRVVLQDLGHSIAKALQTPGIENMAYNYFDEQPIKETVRTGAKFYYMRGVLHNQPDKEARVLLTRTKAAMAPDSVLLIDELVLAEQGLDSYSATVDLTMMAATASMERTEEQWHHLLDSVGLRLVKSYPYNPATYESVMDTSTGIVGAPTHAGVDEYTQKGYESTTSQKPRQKDTHVMAALYIPYTRSIFLCSVPDSAAIKHIKASGATAAPAWWSQVHSRQPSLELHAEDGVAFRYEDSLGNKLAPGAT